MAERSGAKSQLTGVIGAVLITLMIVFIPGLFRNLPQPALAAVVITASLSLADIPGTVRLWHQRKTKFALSIAASSVSPCSACCPGSGLGRVEGLEGHHDVHSYPAAQHLPRLVIYRWDAPLFFANAKTFRDDQTGAEWTDADPSPRREAPASSPTS